MNRPPRGGGSAPSSLYGTEPLGPGTPPGRRSMPPDLQSPRQMATTPPDLIVRPGFRPGSGGPPGTYRSDPPAGAAGPYRPGAGGRQSQADGRGETGQAEPMASGLGRRGTVNLQSYPRMLSRNINGTGEQEKLSVTKFQFCRILSFKMSYRYVESGDKVFQGLQMFFSTALW